MGNKFKRNKQAGVSTNQQGETLTREREKEFKTVIAELKGELKKTDLQLRQQLLAYEQSVAETHDIISKNCWTWKRWSEYWVVYWYIQCLAQLNIVSDAELCSEHLGIDPGMAELSWRQLQLDGLLQEDFDEKTGEKYHSLMFPFLFVDKNKETKGWKQVLNAQGRLRMNGEMDLSIEEALKEAYQS